MGESAERADVEVFIAGTVGEPGQRTFYVQLGDPGDLITLKLEKQQVAALAEFLAARLVDLDPVTPDEVPLALDLVPPVDPWWAVGELAAEYDDDADRIVIVAEELVRDDEPAGQVRFTITRPQGVAFVDRARRLVAAGRPPCRWCGLPLDGDGLWCPCYN